MADADKTLKLLIELGVVGKEDAEAAGKLLEDQKKSVQELADEEVSRSREIIAQKEQEAAVLEKLQLQRKEYAAAGRNTAELDDALHRLNGTLQESGHHMNSGRQAGVLFRRSLMSIGAYIPGMEYAVMGGATAFGALTAGVIGGGIALEKLIAYFKSFDEALAALDSGELKNHQDAIDRVRSSWEDAQVALGKYYADMDTAGKDADPIKTQIDQIKQLKDAQLDSIRAQIEEMGKLEVQTLRANKASPAEIAAAEERTRRAVGKVSQEKDHFDTVGVLDNEQFLRDVSKDDLNAAALVAQKKAKEADDAFKANKKREDDASAELNPTTDAGKARLEKERAADAKLNAAQSIPEFNFPSEGDPTGSSNNAIARQEAIDKSNQELAELKRQRDQQQSILDKASARTMELERAKDSAATEAARANSASVTNEDRRRRIPGELTQAQNVESVKSSGAQALDIINSHGGRTNQALGEVAAAIGLSEQQKLNIVQRILNHTLTLQQAWAGLNARLAQMEAQNAHNRGLHGNG